MLRTGYVYVNIHNTSMIPIIRRKGPIYNMGMSEQFYKQLRMFPDILIYPVNDDPLIKNGVPINNQGQTQQVTQTRETNETKQVKVEKAVEVKEPKIEDSLDKMIEEKLKELPEEVDVVQDIILDENDMKEISVNTSSKIYERKALELMKRDHLVKILNVERGYKIGDKYYAGYHDNKKALISFILESQK
jgi:hypothetical protein